MLAEKGFDLSGKHMDCGIEIYDEKQDAHAGGSGCGCSAVVLSALILKKLEEGEWKRVLFVPTGALLSKTSFNEGKSIPGIAHCTDAGENAHKGAWKGKRNEENRKGYYKTCRHQSKWTLGNTHDTISSDTNRAVSERGLMY